MDPPPSRQNAPTAQEAQISPIHDEDCAFCQIITAYPIVSPLDPSYVSSEALNPEKLYPPAFVLLSTEHVVAFLDIFPLVRGHVLLCPRRHAEKIGDMTAVEGTEIGRILPLLSRAVVRATMPDIPHAEVDYNVVQNNGPGAAQVVPHTHFHIIPRYPFESTYTPYSKFSPSTSTTNPPPRQRKPPPQGIQATAILFGRGQRHYRDDDDAEGLIKDMRAMIAEEWRKEFGGESATSSKGAAAAAVGEEGEERLEGLEAERSIGGEVEPRDPNEEVKKVAARNKVVREDAGGGGKGGRGRGNL